MSLTEEQRFRVRTFLTGQGLTFQPLLEELVDHVSTDMEEKLSQGVSFDEAWRQTFDELPENHFKQIQKETMETINKRFTVSQSLSFLTLGLLVISMAFKSLHLPGSSGMLLLAFGTLAGTLLFSSLSGIHLNREKKGGARVLGVVAGIGILLFAFSFKLLHLSGADELVVAGVVITVVSLIANAGYVYRHASGSGNLLTFLHEKYTPGIERFLLLLLLPLVVLRLINVVNPEREFAGGIVTLVVIFGAGLQLVALSWRAMEKDLSKRSAATLVATIASGMLLTLVFLGPVLPVELRIGMIMTYTIVSAWLAYSMQPDRRDLVQLPIAFFLSAIFVAWGLVRLGVLPTSMYGIFFNVPVLLLVAVAIFLCRKHETMRTYAIVTFASYLFEYVV
jgi:hypothetical protein